ncbi:N-acetylmuramoyl-L-alanine amidase [Bacteroidia bacterium]|nr:N-acetylmuramoyl-L-alanine amidase [Bacteroidia bacterium]
MIGTTTLVGQTSHPYIEKHNTIAVMQMHKYKIPASIILAQGILESGWGLSECASKHNNHFGVKADSSWKGEIIYLPTKEFRNGKMVNEHAYFRKYSRVADSYEDHSIFLKKPRYAGLFSLEITDYQGWAHGLQRCGYATDPDYGNKLIQLIENQKLNSYDLRLLPKFKHAIYKDHGLLYVLAGDGDSFESIASDLNMKASKLQKYNELPEETVLSNGAIIYLEKKHSKADKPYYEHIVSDGESAYQIAQMYGMRVKTLYRLNKLKINAGLVAGDVLRLR